MTDVSSSQRPNFIFVILSLRVHTERMHHRPTENTRLKAYNTVLNSSLNLFVIWREPTSANVGVLSLHRMHEMQTIVTDESGVCLSVCLSRGLTRLHCAKTAKRVRDSKFCVPVEGCGLKPKLCKSRSYGVGVT